mmetsp:Transcript_37120/g.74313  ORF Transcript_37120/g.74313 Transcript_37120/m.74313 type:complete len:192 (-) Transcript_37120:714-1289(-)
MKKSLKASWPILQFVPVEDMNVYLPWCDPTFLQGAYREQSTPLLSNFMIADSRRGRRSIDALVVTYPSLGFMVQLKTERTNPNAISQRWVQWKEEHVPTVHDLKVATVAKFQDELGAAKLSKIKLFRGTEESPIQQESKLVPRPWRNQTDHIVLICPRRGVPFLNLPSCSAEFAFSCINVQSQDRKRFPDS